MRTTHAKATNSRRGTPSRPAGGVGAGRSGGYPSPPAHGSGEPTIGGIRRGDVFTRASGGTFVAFDDARPNPDFTHLFGRPIVDVSLVTYTPRLRAHGLYELGSRLLDLATVVADAPVRIHERGLRVHHVTEDPHPGSSRTYVQSMLEHVLHLRAVAGRPDGDDDARRDRALRDAHATGLKQDEIDALAHRAALRAHHVLTTGASA